MEIEKPFKCGQCNARFTNEDHLYVHKRRHEMSLNLKSNGGGQLDDNFSNETPTTTPTPTRFFRNCEEIGLFQDICNNPFDESFSKAANNNTSTSSTGTPSSTGVDQFDFNSITAIPTSATIIQDDHHHHSATASSSSSSNKRRYSDHDTLNTPQVFGYLNLSTNTPTATNFSSTTTTVLNPSPLPGEGGDDKISWSLGERKDGDEVDEDSNNTLVLLGNRSRSIGQKPKTSLKLNLSPITPIIFPDISGDDSNLNNIKKKGKDVPLKTEILERNREAAFRARQRRKQWLSTVESRCEALEKALAQTKSELIKEKDDNQYLRAELSKHLNCDVTKSLLVKENEELSQVQMQHEGIQMVLVQPSKSPKSNTLISQPSITKTTNDILQSTEQERVISNNYSLSQKPRIPAKRGRPRKGEERRVQGFYFSAMPNTSTTSKIQLPAT